MSLYGRRLWGWGSSAVSSGQQLVWGSGSLPESLCPVSCREDEGRTPSGVAGERGEPGAGGRGGLSPGSCAAAGAGLVTCWHRD